MNEQFQLPAHGPFENFQSCPHSSPSTLTTASIYHDPDAGLTPGGPIETSWSNGAPNSAATPMSSNSHWSSHGLLVNLQYPTDDLCSRELLKQIINEFLQHLYPLIPVFHLPTFRANLERNRDIQDKHFLSMLLASCAVTVSISCEKFRQYRSATTPIRFQTRLEMVDYCYSLCIQLRGPRYFDQVSHTKWAIPYLFYLAYFHIGEHNKSRMVESEAILFARLLELHRVSAYSGLNCIEIQLRKKAFWMMFYGYVHLQLQNHRKERLAFFDCSLLHELDLEWLLPVPQDDEQITESSYGTFHEAHPTLTMGFNYRSRLFWAAISQVGTSRPLDHSAVHCNCTRLKDPAAYMEFLCSRFYEVKYMLDSVPWYLRQWNPGAEYGESEGLLPGMDASETEILRSQLATLRADIHVTHLWLQSIILDQLDTFPLATSGRLPTSQGVSGVSPRPDWFAREDICRQLLLLLCSVSEASLTANGMHLVYKVRDVAGSLLACPFKEEDQLSGTVGPATRAKEYLRDFTKKLRQLDQSETINSISLQTWVDTDRNEDGNYHYW